MRGRVEEAAFVPSHTRPPHEVTAHGRRPIHIVVHIGTWREKWWVYYYTLHYTRATPTWVNEGTQWESTQASSEILANGESITGSIRSHHRTSSYFTLTPTMSHHKLRMLN